MNKSYLSRSYGEFINGRVKTARLAPATAESTGEVKSLATVTEQSNASPGRLPGPDIPVRIPCPFRRKVIAQEGYCAGTAPVSQNASSTTEEKHPPGPDIPVRIPARRGS